MTFMRKFNTLLRKYRNKIYIIDSDDGINMSIYDTDFNNTLSKKIENGNFSFIDYWFDITSSNDIYGIINDKINSLIYVRITDRLIAKSTLLKYDPETIFIKFVTIKKSGQSTHVFYYELDKLNAYSGKLINHYNDGNEWLRIEIDSFSYNVLTNFVVTYDKDFSPSIFYYKLTNGFEELYVSTFDSQSRSWSNPCRVTDSKKTKIYLSVIRDSKNSYHIIFSENNLNKYYCTYINGYIDDNVFITKMNKKLSDTVACTFPNIIEADNKIYANWIEYHNLYACSSTNYGLTWNNVTVSPVSSSTPFVCCNYHSNNNKYTPFNYFTLFMAENSDKILGLD